MQWIKNRWHAAAWSSELRDKPLARRFFGENMVLYRQADGTPAMLLDRCPHKGAPLSLGELKNGLLSCPYHGLTFDCSGRCVHIPSQSSIPPSAQVRAFPCVERHGLAWFWPGDPALAQDTPLFDFPNIGAPGWHRIEGPYTLFPASLEDILDNLVDPAHTSFVHRKTIGGTDAGEVPITVEEGEGAVTAGRWIEDSEPVPVMRRYGRFDGRVDRWQYYHLYLPNISLVDMGAVDAGGPRDEAARNRQYRTLSYAALTPQAEDSTHYFWFVLRCFALGDAQVDAEMRQAYADTFDEDRALLGAIRANGGMQGGSLRLAIDNASIRARRAYARLAEHESAAARESAHA